MGPGASTPEELETILEDAFVLRDREALVELDDGAVLVAGRDRSEARGAVAIARSVEALWSGERGYVAEPRRVVHIEHPITQVKPWHRKEAVS